MSEFEKTNSSEDLSSLLPICELIPIKPKSISNLIDMMDGPNSRASLSPKKKFYSMDDIFDASVRKENIPLGTMSDCIPSPSSGSSYASSSASDSSTGSSSSPTCEISLLERLIRTHPLWFLPSLQRSGALHLLSLQGREVGNFIVRSSTQPLTMAVSVKLPGNHVEHYLLKAIGNRIALENSTHTFETVHQLIAHYCEASDEIPVCLRVPTSIAEATTRQQLRSLALLGQEFWSISSGGCVKEQSSTSDIEVSRNFTSGLGSQSSSSHSLCDASKKPNRPTTLELGTFGGGNNAPMGTTATPPPVPLRWSRSALLTPLSQPSSVQSTPSEVQSTFSEKSGRPGKKKKINSGGHKAESIHYKDTEIVDLFKGTKTVYDDKASDYEDIWSPQYYERSHTPRLSTFKPDLIPSSYTPEAENINNILYKKHSPNQNKAITPTVTTKVSEDLLVQSKNIQNHRLSYNENLNQSQTNIRVNDNGVKQNIQSDETNNKEDLGSKNDVNRKSAGLYSEPVDSITFRRFGSNRNSEPNIRWSQPVLSLLKIDFTGGINEDGYLMETTAGSGKGKVNIIEQNLEAKQENTCRSFHSSINEQSRNISHRSSLADVSLTNKSGSQQMCASRIRNNSSNKNSQKKNTVTCASVDNLCHLRDFTHNKKSQKLNRGPESCEKLEREVDDINIGISPAVTPLNQNIEERRLDNKNIIDTSNNQSWRLDSSWEFVMWQKEEEQRLMENVAKFPIPSPPNSPSFLGGGRRRVKESSIESKTVSQNDDSLSSTNNNSGLDSSSNANRFSRYDNLEGGKTDEENSGEESQNFGADGQEKISSPWDSSKWEHLLRLVSESSQQLDSLQMIDNQSNRNNVNLYLNKIQRNENESKSLETDPMQRVSKILDVSGNVDKASKAVIGVVKSLANKDDGVFGPTLKSFISCTIAAKAQDPHKVMRNVRQFISGMKNYLVGVNSESENLRKEIKKQTENLSDCEFLNIDAILEEVLVELVISPLNVHIRGLIDAQNSRNPELSKLSQSGVRPTEHFQHHRNHNDLHRQEAHEKLQKIYLGFEDSVSPMKKLDKWNEFVCQVQELENYSSESFLPLLSETLGSVSTPNLPSHVDYMIGLLPSSLAEQNNYSLSLLQSAISALKSRSGSRKGSVALSSVRVLVPDERNGTLIRKMVPVRDSTTNKEVAKMVASKLGITNPGDYILVTIKNGEESICPESELVYNFVEDGNAALAYKRVDAKIGWPQKIS